MIKSIVINNFQSHKKTILKLSRGVNVIVGKSQAGKTAILRALNWVLNNRPSGSRFVRHGQSKTSVTVRTYEGNKITLKKTTRGLTYFVNGEPFRKFGKKVPEEVEGIFRMSSVNIQDQLDIPYLVTSSGGDVARTINKITKAEEADKWIQHLTREINKSRRESSLITTDIADIRSKIKNLAGVKKLDKKAEYLGEVLLQRKIKIDEWNELRLLIKNYQEIEDEMETLKPIIRLESKSKRAEIKSKKSEELKEDIKLLNYFIAVLGMYKRIGRGLAYLEQKTAQIDQIDRELGACYDDIDNLDSWITTSEEKNRTEDQLEALREKYIEIIENEKICPFCFSEIDEEATDRIQESL